MFKKKYLKYKKKYSQLKKQTGGLDCSELTLFPVGKKKQKMDNKMIKKKKMRHFTDDEIKNYKLKQNIIEKSECYLSTMINDLEPALYMYVAVYNEGKLDIIINPNILPSDESSKKNIIFPLVINHSNLYKGEPTNCGGLIKINEKKKISYIDNQSGHYSPDFKSLKCIVKLLHQLYPNCIEPDLVIMNWDHDIITLSDLLE